MSSLALGNPVVAYAYKYDAKGSAFNKLFYNILSPGIYNGGGLSFSGNQIIVGSYDALFPYASSSQLIATHTSSAINLSTSVGLGGYGLGNITSSLPYIAMYFIWTDSEGVYPDYGFYDSSVVTNASYLVLGKATFSGSNVNGFDYSVATYPPRYNPTTKGLNVRGLTESTSTSTGSVVINGGVGIAKSLQVGTAVTTPLITAGDTVIAGQSIELAKNRGSDGESFIDFHARPGTDLEARIIRWAGVNGDFDVANTGTGNINISNPAGGIKATVLSTSSFDVVAGSTLSIKGYGIATSSPNLHLDAGTGATYINYISGSGINFCNGAGTITASVSNNGGIFSNSSVAEAHVGVENKQQSINTYIYSNNTGRGLWDSSAGDIIRRNWTDSAWTFTGNLTGNAATSSSCTGNATTASGTAFMGQGRDSGSEWGIATEWDGSRQYIHGWRRGATNAKSGSETRVNYADNAGTSSSCTGNATTATNANNANTVGGFTPGMVDIFAYSTSTGTIGTYLTNYNYTFNSGYMVFRTGLIFQWGYTQTSINPNGFMEVVYPMSFPTAVFSVVATIEDHNQINNVIVQINKGSQSLGAGYWKQRFTARLDELGNATQADHLNWFAIGY